MMRMSGMLFRLAMVAAAASVASSTAIAQQTSDSARARRHAVRAQEHFEQVRRIHLPLRYSSPIGPCDAHIGRFCQWNSPDDTVEAPEKRTVRRARATLLETLDSASRLSPRDGWITGQRVRYLLEMRNDTAAVRVARSCQAEVWWCAALEGLALHEGWNGAGADSAFARALRAMTNTERCRWTDMTPLLDTDQRKRFGKVGCDKNDLLAERLWWMADPFWSLPGNDRRTEHYARHTMAKILEPAQNVYNLRWANDLREMIVRYGWARWWTRGAGTALEPNGGPISGHEATPNYHFIPVSFSVDSVPAASFDLDRDASVERYAPVMARRLFEIDPQVAVFKRGDSALVVAAYDVSTRREFDSTDVSASLVVARDQSASWYRSSVSGKRGAMSVLVDTRPQFISVELVDLEDREAAAWKRKALPLTPGVTGSVTMSDVLLFEPGNAEVGELDSAMATAFGSSDVGRAKVGVYWETYGLARTDSATPVSLTLTRVAPGTLRRIGESIGLTSKASPLKISWRQTMSVGNVTARSVVLDLSLIPRGRYVLKVETGPTEAPLAATSRVLEIQ